MKGRYVKKDLKENKKLYAEQLGLLFDSLPLSILTNIIISLILVFTEWPVLEHNDLILWLTIMIVVQALRLVIHVGYSNYNNFVEIKKWGYFFIAGSTATALVWASNIIFIFPTDIEYQVFVAFVVAGMSAGAVTTLSALRVPIVSFLIILLSPLITRFFLQDSSIGIAMALMVAVFLVILLSSAIRMYRNTRQNIILKYEAIDKDAALKESESKYRHIFESVPLGIAHYGHDGAILDHNSVYKKLTGRSDDELKAWNLFTNSNNDEFCQQVSSSLENRFVQYEGHATVVGGSSDTAIRVFLTTVQLEQESSPKGVAIVQDITEDMRVEKAKQEFISSVSHELRTPLTSIQAVLGLINGGQLGEISDEMKPLIDIAHKNSRHLTALINDILELEEMQSGELTINAENVEALTLIEDALLIMQPYAEQCAVKLKLLLSKEKIFIHVDGQRFTQILCNLLSNASKFSPRGADVFIKVKQVNNTMRIEIIDQGSGIPEEFHDEIFDRFTQSDSSDTRPFGGSGLGLNISQLLVKRMNGEIGFTTEKNKGTTFFIEFPIVDV